MKKSAPRLVPVRIEIAGLLRKMMINDDTKIVKSCVSGFSRGKLEAGRNELGLCTARYESKSCC